MAPRTASWCDGMSKMFADFVVETALVPHGKAEIGLVLVGARPVLDTGAPMQQEASFHRLAERPRACLLAIPNPETHVSLFGLVPMAVPINDRYIDSIISSE